MMLTKTLAARLLLAVLMLLAVQACQRDEDFGGEDGVIIPHDEGATENEQAPVEGADL